VHYINNVFPSHYSRPSIELFGPGSEFLGYHNVEGTRGGELITWL